MWITWTDGHGAPNLSRSLVEALELNIQKAKKIAAVNIVGAHFEQIPVKPLGFGMPTSLVGRIGLLKNLVWISGCWHRRVLRIHKKWRRMAILSVTDSDARDGANNIGFSVTTSRTHDIVINILFHK
jgi:hypothetical protein